MQSVNLGEIMKIHPEAILLDPEFFIRRSVEGESRHINLRLSGRDLQGHMFLKSHFPEITDSLRIRDCVRTVALLFALRDKGTPVKIQLADGSEKDLLEYIGAFIPQTPMDTRKRSA
jgi:hypothetical protein